MKVLEVWPAATVTLEGTVRLVLLLESDIANPPAGAAPVKDTEQEVFPGVLIVELVQLKPPKATVVTGREIAPEPPLAGMEEPVALVATAFLS